MPDRRGAERSEPDAEVGSGVGLWEFAGGYVDGDGLPSPRERTRRFAHALTNVIEALEVGSKAASRLAGVARDRLLTLDEDGDDQLATEIRRAATAYMTR